MIILVVHFIAFGVSAALANILFDPASNNGANKVMKQKSLMISVKYLHDLYDHISHSCI